MSILERIRAHGVDLNDTSEAEVLATLRLWNAERLEWSLCHDKATITVAGTPISFTVDRTSDYLAQAFLKYLDDYQFILDVREVGIAAGYMVVTRTLGGFELWLEHPKPIFDVKHGSRMGVESNTEIGVWRYWQVWKDLDWMIQVARRIFPHCKVAFGPIYCSILNSDKDTDYNVIGIAPLVFHDSALPMKRVNYPLSVFKAIKKGLELREKVENGTKTTDSG